MNQQRATLARQALNKSIEVRRRAGFDLKSPICIYDLCEKMEVSVRFVNFSMEGLYAKKDSPAILISALRPLHRRNFTCAHEVGHHVFDHGFRVDEICEEMSADSAKRKKFVPEEFLADCFAGFTLMPPPGLRQAFAARGWEHGLASPSQYFAIACQFGVSYEALVVQVLGSKLITDRKAGQLLKTTPKMIREEILGRRTSEPLLVVDHQWRAPTIDTEVGHLLLLPAGVEASANNLVFEQDMPTGRLFRVTRPGLMRVHNQQSGWAAFVRIMRYEYAGLSRYRHLDDDTDEVEDD